MLSIIIPTFNRKEIIKATLDYLSRTGELHELKHEVIVVNDGDVELSDLENLLAGLNIKVVKNTGKGAATARNFGAKLSAFDLLLFVDDDILLAKGSIKQVIDFHEKNKNCLLSGTWEYSPEVIEKLNRTPFGRFKIENDYTCMGGVEKRTIAENLFESDTLASFCLSMSKDTFNRIGGFNEDFPYAGCEDQEFSAKALNLGVKLNYSTTIKTFHNELDRVDKGKWLKRQYTGVQGFPLLCELFPERKSSALFIENHRITSGDNLNLKIKKVVKKIIYGKTGFYVLTTLTGVMEKASIFEPILNRCYRLMGGMMIYQGFQYGQKSLSNQKDI